MAFVLMKSASDMPMIASKTSYQDLLERGRSGDRNTDSAGADFLCAAAMFQDSSHANRKLRRTPDRVQKQLGNRAERAALQGYNFDQLRPYRQRDR